MKNIIFLAIICLLVDCTLSYERTCAFRSDSSSFSFETSSFVSLSNSSFEWRLLKIEYIDMKITTCVNNLSLHVDLRQLNYLFLLIRVIQSSTFKFFAMVRNFFEILCQQLVQRINKVLPYPIFKCSLLIR